MNRCNSFEPTNERSIDRFCHSLYLCNTSTWYSVYPTLPNIYSKQTCNTCWEYPMYIEFTYYTYYTVLVGYHTIECTRNAVRASRPFTFARKPWHNINKRGGMDLASQTTKSCKHCFSCSGLLIIS